MDKKIKLEVPPLEKEDLDARVIKEAAFRAGSGVRLRSLSQSRDLRKVFGTGISTNLASLSRYDARKGALSDAQRENIRIISSSINHKAKEQMGLEFDLVSPEEFENILKTGDASSFVYSVAEPLVRWKAAQPLYKQKIWTGMERGELKTALSDEVEAELAIEGEGSSITDIITTVIEIVMIAKKVVNFVAGLAESFCGPENESHTTPPDELPEGLTLRRDSYLHVPWREIEWGDNNQEFVAQYLLEVNGGRLDELRVKIRVNLEGSGFDDLEYPIEAAAIEHEGYSYPIPTEIRSTDYQQIHEVVARDVQFLVISVGGRVNYGSDGFMTGAGLVPRGTATKDGHSLEFGCDDSIWRYGLSI